MLDKSLVKKIQEINKQKVAQYKEIINDIRKIYELTGVYLKINVDKIGDRSTEIKFSKNGYEWIHINRFNEFWRAFKIDDIEMELVNLFLRNEKQIREELNFILSNYLGSG